MLDIGSGWGGMAIMLALEYGARVTGITLSVEQLEEARARAAAANLSDRVTFELQDYRTVTGTYDRIVSIGMFEHVGVTHYGQYFRTLRRLLREDGVALIHAIGPQRRTVGHQSVDHPPHLSGRLLAGAVRSVRRRGARKADRHRRGNSCACTTPRPYATGVGVSTPIATRSPRCTTNASTRLFGLYLAGSEYSFRHLNHMVWQLQLARHQSATPLTRDYMLADRQAEPQRLPSSPTLSRSLRRVTRC